MTDFGEEVLYKLLLKGPGADAQGTLEPRWSRGCMFGFSRYTNEYYCWNGVKIETSKAFQRLKRDLRWNVPALEGVLLTCKEVASTKARSSTRSFVNEKLSHPRKLVRTEPGHRRTLQLSKPTGSGMAAKLGALNAFTPETTDGAKPEDS